MAPTATRKPPASKSPTTPSLSFSLEESEGIKRAPRGSSKHEAYPQVAAAVAKSLTDKKAFKFPNLATEDAVRQAKNMLAQVRNSYVSRGEPIKISQSVEEHSNGTRTLHFQATPGARKYKYSAQQIRDWWKMQPDGGEINGKIPEHVREGFKKAHGFAK